MGRLLMERVLENSQRVEQSLPRTVFTKVQKRSGEYVNFEPHRITKALTKAGLATGEFNENIARKLTLRALTNIQVLYDDRIPTVEEIQDIVEETLLASAYKKTAKAFIIYRDQHQKLRDMVKKNSIKMIDSYLDLSDWKIKENSNMGYSLQGLNNYISGEVTKSYWLNSIYSQNVRDAHAKGDLHIHDLSLLSIYCVGWDLQDVILTGFKGAAGKAESSPAKHFRAILGQIVNFFYTLQGEAAGAQAFSNFDTLLAPFIRYDGLDYKAVKQALQEFIFNVNVPTRVGFQTPFTNVTIDLQVPTALKDQPVIIGGEPQKETYGEFQEEMNTFNRAFLEVLTEGDAKGRVFTFPIPTYNITPDFNWEDDNIEMLWEVAAKYGIPYFANFVNSDMSVDDARSMCCRLRLDVRTLEKRGGGLFGANPLTGSIGVVTLNMPRLGYRAKDEKEFLSLLDKQMDIAKESLIVKRKVLEEFTDTNLYPYTRYYLRNLKKKNGRYWDNHFSTIGLLGMNEACVNLIGKDIGTEEGVAFSERVLMHMRDRMQEYQEESGALFNLEATPAEGTTYRLAKLDQEHYPEIKSVNKLEDSLPIYSNSTQLPVNYSNDIFKVLDLQDGLQSLYTGGTVQHIFLGEAVSDPKAVKSFVRKVCEKYQLPYFTLSPSFSVCPEHGYLKGEVKVCPKCEAKTEVYSRIVGYLRPIDQWNDGKRAEFDIRNKYSVEN
jgi:ribonucleoside-triphosphate reductase